MMVTVLEANYKVSYIQGMHDICSVLLLCLGEKKAVWIMLALVETHLKDYFRSSLETLLSVLNALFPLIGEFDFELYQFFIKSNVSFCIWFEFFRLFACIKVQPFVILSWFLTWFSHNIHEFKTLVHIFDFLIASHPLMPLYICAEVIFVQLRMLSYIMI